MAVDKWSACSSSTLTIPSEFEPCWSLQFFCKIVVEKNENKQQSSGLAHLKKQSSFLLHGKS